MLSARLRQELTLRPHTSSSSQVQRACQEKLEIQVALTGLGTAAARATIFDQCVECFVCPNNGIASSVAISDMRTNADACDCTRML